jgi:hypothetical protein
VDRGGQEPHLASRPSRAADARHPGRPGTLNPSPRRRAGPVRAGYGHGTATAGHGTGTATAGHGTGTATAGHGTGTATAGHGTGTVGAATARRARARHGHGHGTGTLGPLASQNHAVPVGGVLSGAVFSQPAHRATSRPPRCPDPRSRREITDSATSASLRRTVRTRLQGASLRIALPQLVLRTSERERRPGEIGRRACHFPAAEAIDDRRTRLCRR